MLIKANAAFTLLILKLVNYWAALFGHHGNQIFAIEAIPQKITTGFPFVYKSRHSKGQKQNLFYSFSIRRNGSNGNKLD